MSFLLARTVRALPVALALFAFPLRAEAQLSGLLKKAKEQIAKPDAVAPAKSTATASNAQIGDPFDAASLDAALKGMVVVKARQAELAALNKQYVDNRVKRTALVDKSARVIDEYEKKRESNDNCISQDISARTPEREAVAQQKAMAVMSDESTRDEYVKVATAMQGAVAKNDTASLRKLTASYMKMLGVDPQADSIIAFKKCGHPPALPASLIEAERMQNVMDGLGVKMRVVESSADADGARAANTTPAKFKQMRERLVTFSSSGSQWSSSEKALLNGRNAEIQNAVKTP